MSKIKKNTLSLVVHLLTFTSQDPGRFHVVQDFIWGLSGKDVI